MRCLYCLIYITILLKQIYVNMMHKVTPKSWKSELLAFFFLFTLFSFYTSQPWLIFSTMANDCWTRENKKQIIKSELKFKSLTLDGIRKSNLKEQADITKNNHPENLWGNMENQNNIGKLKIDNSFHFKWPWFWTHDNY